MVEGHLRQKIPVCQNMVYLNTGWSGPSPVRVVEDIKRRLDTAVHVLKRECHAEPAAAAKHLGWGYHPAPDPSRSLY